MRASPSFAMLAQPRRGGVLLLAAATFALGLVAGATMAPVAALRVNEPPLPPSAHTAEPAQLRTGYPAQVLRVLDGDTFEARVQIWPGLDVTTKVRLRNIDAPEMRARCSDERVKAEAARAALESLLAEGGVAFHTSPSTNMAGASTPTPPPATPPMFRQRCSVAALHAAMTVADARAGADRVALKIQRTEG